MSKRKKTARSKSGIPNDPAKAYGEGYNAGKYQGTRDYFSMTVMVLTDKHGWVLDDPERYDTIKRLAAEVESLAAEIRAGRIKLRDIDGVLRDELGVEIT